MKTLLRSPTCSKRKSVVVQAHELGKWFRLFNDENAAQIGLLQHVKSRANFLYQG
jgi:hypothetical protein